MMRLQIPLQEAEAAVYNTSADENQYSKDYLHKELRVFT
jgi:hypothetical protein